MSWTSLCTIAGNNNEAILEVATTVPIIVAKELLLTNYPLDNYDSE